MERSPSRLATKERDRGAHPRFDRRVRHPGAVFGRPLRLIGAESETAEPGRHVTIGIRCRSLAPLRRPPSGLALLLHELGAVGLPGLVLIVRTAAEPDVGGARVAALRIGHDMVELEPRSRFAVMSVGAGERASAAVALAHRPPHVGRDVAAIGIRRLASAAWSVRGSELALLEMADREIEHPVEDLLDPSRGNDMA